MESGVIRTQGPLGQHEISGLSFQVLRNFSNNERSPVRVLISADVRAQHFDLKQQGPHAASNRTNRDARLVRSC